jgi:hypothetical protein
VTSDPVDSPPQLPPPAQAAVPIAAPAGTGEARSGVCANCGATLQGAYCTACGQKHEPHVHSVGHFMHEAFESITHADSRVWRTLWLLLSRPGRLTREFFAGRRASHLPPFRLYLVISVVFFLIVGMPEGKQIELQVDPTPSAKRVAEMNDVARALETDLAATPGAVDIAKAVRAQAAREQAGLDAKAAPAADSKPGTPTEDFKQGMRENNIVTEFCKEFEAEESNQDAGTRSYQKLQAFCTKTNADRGTALVEAVVHNIPKAMFVFLPLLALVMKLLYWRPKRYYVEHLTFLVHNHAFVFLALGIMSLVGLIPVVREYTNFPELALWLYIVWYLYRGMRNYYGQGRALTLTKFFSIGFAYLLTSFIVFAFTAVFAVMLT